MTKVLLVSTYELGEQPLGCAIPAAALKAAGHAVRQVDLALEAWPEADLAWAEALAVSVPMHTALRLGIAVVERVRATLPALPVALHGLYAPAGARAGALRPGDLAVAGETGARLLEWVNGMQHGPARGAARSERDAVTVCVERGAPRRQDRKVAVHPPLRSGLPPLDRYARLVTGEQERLVGAVEASTGCNHLCLHCPVPVIYGGRSRPADLEALTLDIDELVKLGASHIHFADPDFLNRPAHALRVASLLHERHPGVSFDATIKVSHLVRNDAVLGELAAAGLCFVVSAFESTSGLVLERLAKGHTLADEIRAITLLRRLGVEIRPSFLPFTPWTTRDDIVELFDFVAAYDLIANVDAVQYGIRLLIPPGSLLLKQPDARLDAALIGYDPAELGSTWRSEDPLLDELAGALAQRGEQAANLGESANLAYEGLRALVFSVLRRNDPGRPVAVSTGPSHALRPHLSESWFCCAEPTMNQLAWLHNESVAATVGQITLADPQRRASQSKR